MDTEEAILCVIKVLENKVYGRTVLQKLLYFLAKAGIVKPHYRTDYFGPYSGTVFSSVERLVSLGYLKEGWSADLTYTFEKYVYTITDSGKKKIEEIINRKKTEYAKLKEIIKKCEEITKLDVYTLCCAAKISHILEKEKRQIDTEEIRTLGKSFNWDIPGEKIDNSIDLLETLKQHLSWY